jgi:hypothetical protein
MNQTKAMASAFADDADALKQNFLLRGFFNRRGYEEPGELKENKISQLPSQPSDKEFAYDAKEIFDKSDNAKLKNEKALDAAENSWNKTNSGWLLWPLLLKSEMRRRIVC